MSHFAFHRWINAVLILNIISLFMSIGFCISNWTYLILKYVISPYTDYRDLQPWLHFMQVTNTVLLINFMNILFY